MKKKKWDATLIIITLIVSIDKKDNVAIQLQEISYLHLKDYHIYKFCWEKYTSKWLDQTFSLFNESKMLN